MKTLEKRLEKHIDLLIERYPALGVCRQQIIDAYLIMEECYEHDGKLQGNLTVLVKDSEGNYPIHHVTRKDDVVKVEFAPLEYAADVTITIQ